MTPDYPLETLGDRTMKMRAKMIALIPVRANILCSDLRRNPEIV